MKLMSDEYIDPERDIISANWSPRLEQAYPVYVPVDTPPPVLTKDSSSSDVSGNEQSPNTRRRRRRRRTQPSQSDRVLIHELEPNRPDIAEGVIKNGINAASDSEEAEESEGEQEPTCTSGVHRNHMVGYNFHKEATRVADAETEGLAVAALKASKKLAEAVSPSDADFPMFDNGNKFAELKNQVRAIPNGVYVNTNTGQLNGLSSSPLLLSAHRELDLKPPPKPDPSRKKTLQDLENHEDENNGENESLDSCDLDSIATSPVLAPYTISPENADPASTLPAMQKSPPRSYSASWPENKQNLPSLTTALSQVSDSTGTPFPGHSPSLTRPSPSHMSHLGRSPSTYSHSSPQSAISPPNHHPHASYWRSTGRNGSISTPSDQAPPSATVSTPSSSIIPQSPANSYRNSVIISSEQSNQVDHEEKNDVESPTNQTAPTNLQSASPFISGGHKCLVQGCNSLPFQTQYLLNSHMNVHSDTRPHFCQIKGCARGPGGQGFKRKNEMIRHGLVHTSPGYMCPYCPDQQHKYPRPDNLLRHVKAHHRDRDREDSALREVLAQRPEGGNRGRRRRLGP